MRDDANPIGAGPHGATLYQGVIIDIAEQRAAAETVRAEERRWRLLLEHLPIVAYQVSFDTAGETFDRWSRGASTRSRALRRWSGWPTPTSGIG